MIGYNISEEINNIHLYFIHAFDNIFIIFIIISSSNSSNFRFDEFLAFL